MKKNYILTLLFTLCLAALSFGQTPIITAIVDGDCSGGNPKLLEVYANGTVDFTLYTLQNQTNTSTTWGSDQDLSALGTVTDGFVYITTSGSSTAIGTEFPSITMSTPLLETNTMNVNGDDRVRIVLTSDNSIVVDQYGVTGQDGTGESWEYDDSYAKRINGTGPDSGFTESNWSIPGFNTLDNLGACKGSGGDTYETLMGGIGTYDPTPSTDPAISITSPAMNQVFPGSTTEVPVVFNIQNFNISADNGSGLGDGSGDGFIKTTLQETGQPNVDANFFTATPPPITVVAGRSYTATAELVDNAGNSLTPITSATVSFSIADPCLLVIGDINTTCDVATAGLTDAFSGSIAFTGGAGGITYTVTAPAGVTVGGDDPSAVASGTITFTGMTEGTNYDIQIDGGAGSSCDFDLTLFSPNCYSLPFEENFNNYTANSDLVANDLWREGSSNTSNPIQVVLNDSNTGLGNFYSSNQFPDPSGNMITLSGSGSDPYIGFEEVTSGTVYASFLFRVTDFSGVDNDNGGYFAVFTENVGFRGRLWIRDTSADTTEEGLTYNLGISTADGVMSTLHTGFTANLVEPVFVVIGYDLDNNEFKLWTVPDPTSFGTNTPPAANVTLTDATADGIDRFLFRQDTSGETPVIDVEDLRVGTSWSDVAPSGMTASTIDSNIDGFAAFPNPVDELRGLTITSNSVDAKTVEIFNVLGRKVFEKSFSGTTDTMDVSLVSTGIYILKVTEGTKVATQKLIIE